VFLPVRAPRADDAERFAICRPPHRTDDSVRFEAALAESHSNTEFSI
jgi:hypothetical protein